MLVAIGIEGEPTLPNLEPIEFQIFQYSRIFHYKPTTGWPTIIFTFWSNQTLRICAFFEDYHASEPIRIMDDTSLDVNIDFLAFYFVQMSQVPGSWPIFNTQFRSKDKNYRGQPCRSLVRNLWNQWQNSVAKLVETRHGGVHLKNGIIGSLTTKSLYPNSEKWVISH